MINTNPKRSDEPVWWSLFGAGGTWFAMITPITVLVLGILAPLGVIDAEALSYERVSSFATSIIGALFIIGTLALPMWHAMHRVHHGMHDLKFPPPVWQENRLLRLCNHHLRTGGRVYLHDLT